MVVNKRNKKQTNQNLFDFIISNWGTMEGYSEFISLNNINDIAQFQNDPVGTEYIVNSESNNTVLTSFKANNTVVVTGDIPIVNTTFTCADNGTDSVAIIGEVFTIRKLITRTDNFYISGAITITVNYPDNLGSDIFEVYLSPGESYELISYRVFTTIGSKTISVSGGCEGTDILVIEATTAAYTIGYSLGYES